MVNWWLDKGLDGFRLDAIINIKKAIPFQSYPADRDDGMVTCTRQLLDARGIGEFLGELRDRCFKPHHAFTVGEVFNEKDEELPDFIGENGYFSSMYDFSATIFGESQLGWQEKRDITPDDYRDCVFHAQKRVGDVGFLSNIIENHDEPRGVSRYIPEGDQSITSKKALATVYFMMKGLPWIYQGQELGMENAKLHSIDEVDDISSLDSYQVALDAGVSEPEALHMIEKYGRDNARTPFQWSDEKNAGFTTGEPWLRVNPNYTEINFAQENTAPDSVFHYYQKLIQLRKNANYSDTLVYGELETYLEDQHNVISYVRKSENQKLLVMANYQNEPRSLKLPSKVKPVLLSNLPKVEIDGEDVQLDGYQVLIAELEA